MVIKVCCIICKNEISSQNLKNHYGSSACKSGRTQIKNNRINFDCAFCGKKHDSLKSVTQHEIRCNKNENRLYSKFSDLDFQKNKCGCGGENQFTKAKRLGHELPEVSDETRIRMSRSATGKKHKETTKNKLSEVAKQKCLGGHTSKKSMYYKKKNGDVVYLHSSYEVKFAEILDQLNIDWERPPPFKWKDNDNVWHRYYPDFKVGDKYFDTKNEYLAIKDAPKIKIVSEQNNIDLQIVRIHQITIDFIVKSVLL